jgi:hypothetical protein
MKYPFGFLGASGGQYDNPYNNPLRGLRDLSVMSDAVPRSTQFLDSWIYDEEKATGRRNFKDEYIRQQFDALYEAALNTNQYTLDTCEIDLTDNRNFYFEEDFQTFNIHFTPNLIFWLGVDFQINFTGTVPNVASLPASGNLYDIVFVLDVGQYGEWYWWNPDTTSWVPDATGNFIYNGGDVSVAWTKARSIRDSLNSQLRQLYLSFEGTMPAAKWYPSFQINKYKI